MPASEIYTAFLALYDKEVVQVVCTMFNDFRFDLNLLHHTAVCNGANVITSEYFLMEWNPVYVPPWYPFKGHSLPLLLKTKCDFSSTLRKQKSSLNDL